MDIISPEIPGEGMFLATEHIEGRNLDLEYHWVPIEAVGNLEVYPTESPKLLGKLDEGVKHFVYKE